MWVILDAIKALLTGLLTRWWGERTLQKEMDDAVIPFKRELDIKNKPAGSDDDLTDRL